MSGINVDRYFQRLAQFRATDNWYLVHEDDTGARIDFATSKNATVVRTRRIESVTLDQKIAMTRPEFQAIAHTVLSPPPPFRKRILEHLAPGDAIVQWYPEPGSSAAHSAVQMIGLRAMAWTMGMVAGALDFSKTQILRMLVRRDYPKQGQSSGICVHLECEDGTGSGAGALSPCFYFSSTSLGDGSTVLTEQWMEVPWPNFPSWWGATLKRFLTSFGRFCNQCYEPEVLSRAQGLFAIASIRSCPRGPPLLPFRKDDRKAVAKNVGIEMGDYIWVPAQADGFSFSEYLQHLMRCLSMEPVGIFDSLDGRKLAPYQAAIFRPEDGEELLPVEVRDLFHLQQAAYRRLLGGKCAPKIHFGGRASFLDLKCEAPLMPARVIERKTFVEWADDVPMGQQQLRSAEYP